MAGPTLRFHSDAVIAITGADMGARLDGKLIPMWQPVEVQAECTLRLGAATVGARTYIAIRGGVDVPAYLNSRSTFILGKFGGHAGRTLRPGDMLRWNANGDFIPLTSSRGEHQVPIYSNDCASAYCTGLTARRTFSLKKILK